MSKFIKEPFELKLLPVLFPFSANHVNESSFAWFSFLKTRKLKELLENNLGWEFQQNSAVDGMYFEDDDEVGIYLFILIELCSLFPLFFFSHNP